MISLMFQYSSVLASYGGLYVLKGEALLSMEWYAVLAIHAPEGMPFRLSCINVLTLSFQNPLFM